MMDNNQAVVIPEGWTYFAHRTNTERWQEEPFSKTSIHLTKLMSVVTERDIYRELEDYGPDHYQGYSSGNGTPFEIRCLICNLPYLRTLSDDNEMKGVMLHEFYYDRRNFGGCYGQRHHSIPKDEELVVLGISDYDEVFKKRTKIIWTIPKRFIKFYKEEVNKNNNRIISFVPQNIEEENKTNIVIL